MYGLNHTGSGLWISVQFLKRGVNLRHRPLPQWLSCTARTDNICKFNAMPHYPYLKLKMPGPRGVITVNGNTERSLRKEDHTAALQQRHKAACSDRPLIWRYSPRTPSSESGIICKRIAWRDLRSPSNSAPVPVLLQRRNSCHTYITTH